jgi:NodT family efflux transporter outer membrane factor (OMF) lipoprotein
VIAALGPALGLGACDFAPAYQAPPVALPANYKNLDTSMWQTAHPADDQPRGDWWLSFGDSALDTLEPQVELANQDLAAALASYEQARAYVVQAESQFYPSLAHNSQLSDNRQSDNRPLRGANEPDYYGNNFVDATAGYEVDLWGRIRDAVAASKAQAQASGAIFESVRIGLQAELARDYLNLRFVDQQQKLLQDTVSAYRAALDLTRERYQGKIAAPIDVERARVQLEVAKAQLTDLTATRALLQDAIATLIGRPASNFTIPSSTRAIRVPDFPPGVPSTLLERRPDVAAAERETAAANERIGIAKAAFFPRFTINLLAGTQDTGLNLLNLANSFWSVGPTVYLPLFDGGLRAAQLTAAEAAYREEVARYRGTVLKAIQDVEDSLALTRTLEKEVRSARAAATAAERAQDLALQLYREGATNYLEVVVAQTAALSAELNLLNIETRRQQAVVALILALGGGFTVDVAAQADPPHP